MKNLAEELTEAWVDFEYKDPYEEVYQRAVKVVEECDRMIALSNWIKEVVGNLEKKLEKEEEFRRQI
jgi:hypothetical protein